MAVKRDEKKYSAALMIGAIVLLLIAWQIYFDGQRGMEDMNNPIERDTAVLDARARALETELQKMESTLPSIQDQMKLLKETMSRNEPLLSLKEQERKLLEVQAEFNRQQNKQ